MRADPKTISEKILSMKSGQDARAGDIVEAEVDYVMVNDVTGPLAFQEFEALGCEPIRDRIVLIPDHFVPNKDVASAQQAKEMRDFAKRWDIKNYYEVGRGGVCHQVMLDHGFAYPGALVVGADSHTCTYGGVTPSPPGWAAPKRLRYSPPANCGSGCPSPYTCCSRVVHQSTCAERTWCSS
jgi:3-isopropylmalate/(R)-2-methylmalate dehydratase large subunit